MKIKLKQITCLLTFVLLFSIAGFAQQTAEEFFKSGLEKGGARKFDEAIADFDAALKLNPALADAYAARGNMYAQKRLREPEKSFLELAKIYDNLKPGDTIPKSPNSLKAIADLSKAIELVPNSPNAFAVRGQIYLKEKDFSPAVDDFRQFLKLVPNNPAAEKALADAEKELIPQLEGFIPSKYFIATDIKNDNVARRKALEAVVEMATKLLQLSPNSATGYKYRAKAYGALEKYDLAVADYDQIIKIDPTEKIVLIERVSIYSKQKNYTSALAEYERLIALPDNEENKFFIDQSYIGRGSVYLAQGKHDLAMADFNHLIQKNPDNAQALYYRGLVYLDKGDRTRAIDDFKKAVSINPKYQEPKIELQKLGIKS